MSIIDPYELLGVSSYSTKDEIKKAYYDLCLIVHPDRGGSKEDMIVLINAYKYVYEFACQVKSFEEYCSSYLDEIPSFREIFDECVYDTKIFNTTFMNIIQSNEIYAASLPGGHGDWLSSPNLNSNVVAQNAMITFTEPLSCNEFDMKQRMIMQVHNAGSNFTVLDKPFTLSDCQEAFENLNITRYDVNNQRSLSDIENERNNEDIILTKL